MAIYKTGYSYSLLISHPSARMNGRSSDSRVAQPFTAPVSSTLTGVTADLIPRGFDPPGSNPLADSIPPDQIH